MPDGSRRLNDADAMFLTVERAAGATYAPVTLTVMERSFDDQAATDHLAEVLARLLPALRRRIQRDRWSPALPRWVDVEGFDVDSHVVTLPAPGDGTLRAVLDWAADWSRLPMSLDRPPWRAAYFEGVTVDGVAGRMVSLSQVHHAAIDGEGGRRMAEQYLQWSPDGHLPPMPPAPVIEQLTARQRWREGWALEGGKAGGLVQATSARLRWALEHPRAGAARARELAAAVGRFQRQQGSEARSPLLASRSDRLRFDLVPVDLAALKAGARTAGGTVNDGLMAALSLALHQYHLDHGLRVPALRTAIAVNTRDAHGGHEGNAVVAVIIDHPLVDDPASAVKLCHDVTRAHVEDRDVLWLVDRFRALANRLPAPIIVPATRKALAGIDLQVSNVTGISLRHWVAGVEALRGAALAVAGPSALSVLLVSGPNSTELAVTTDPEAIPDPEHLVRRLREAFAAVAALAPAWT